MRPPRLPRRPNYRGRSVVFPLGAPILCAALIAIAPCLALGLDLGPWPIYLTGVAVLGLIDDAFGGQSPRGLRAHGAALASGAVSTGAIKAAGTVALALLATSGILDALLLALATHLGNLLDTRPGRAEKALLLVGTGGCVSAATVTPLESLAPFVGPVAVGASLTLRERAMLGDSGAGLIGGLIGVCLVMTTTPMAAAAAVAVLIAISLYGEFRSISAAIEEVPLLERLDSLGRGN